MSFTGHLLLLAAVLLPYCVSAVQGRRSHSYHESWRKRNNTVLRNLVRGTELDNEYNGPRNSSKRLGGMAPNLIPIDQFRKPFDQFKWPWKNYEEWKRHQKRLEDKIDRMLKPRNRRFPSNTRSKKSSFHKKRAQTKRVEVDKFQKKHKRTKIGRDREQLFQLKLEGEAPLPKTTTETATRSSISTHFPYGEFSTGGVVLAVKYYSTSDK